MQFPVENEVGPSSRVHSTFEMMVARKVVRSSDIVDSLGKALTNVLADVFWCIDDHHGSLDGSTSKKTKDYEMFLSLGCMFVDSWQHNNINSHLPACIPGAAEQGGRSPPQC